VIGATEVPQMNAAPIYITVAEAAQLVSVDEKTLGRWTREATDFPVLRRGRVVRIHRERFLAWLERQMPRRGTKTTQPTVSAA
jgi:excisionase family DNA binding protein